MRRPTLHQDRAGTDITAGPDFFRDKLRGDAGEDYARRVFQGSHQVKNDERALETAHLYFECFDDPGARGEWRPSGWQKCDAEFWSHKVGDLLIILPVTQLQHLCSHFWTHRPEMRKTQPHGSCPTWGLVVPAGVFVATYCIAMHAALTRQPATL